MAFVTKTWKDRLVEYAGRRKLKNVATGEEILMDVSRSEGTVSQAGDTFSAANMNNLEQRIKNEFDTVNSSLGGMKFGTDGDGNYGYYGADGSLIPFNKGLIIKKLRFGNGNGTIRPECWMEIDCSNANTISYTPIGNVGTSYSRSLRIYSDWSNNPQIIYSQSAVTGRQEIDISEYDSVILLFADWEYTSSFLVSDIELS